MGLRSFVVRGLAKEVEEDINKILESHPGCHLVSMGQSESGDHITVTLVLSEPDALD